ncbi:carboxypeptidase-like regulatory domain-containing protein [Thermoflexibacter ruber]|uniref:CarboxypepD_reg-like domain-containing protein n=1 Tax=Thermoflexibacter ruber TaxID=1003 RepID=A0A1I2FXZ7_9BACT|nr:carboxypeptidase-like regulatory domain-containing protein [Thermoflexibacter ruber]SFF09677.1 CarboxypepD_reg-like domain-containing protein [Thermoflexibacter ruber]
MKRLSLVFVSLFWYLVAQAQVTLPLAGKIVDAQTGKAVAYASIGIVGTNVSTVTNEMGDFRLNIASDYLNEYLTVHCLSYKTYQVQISSIKDPNHLLIALEVQEKVLKQVVVRPTLTPEKILEKVIQNLKKYHASEAYEQTIFFRTTTQVNNIYNGMAEAVADIYNGGYKEAYAKDKYQYLNSDIEIIKELRQTHYSLKYTAKGDPKCGIKIYDMLRIKKDLIHRGVLNKDNINKMKFSINEHTSFSGKEVIVIHFTPKEKYIAKLNDKPFREIQELLYSGKIYIDWENLVLLKIEVSTSDFTKQYIASQDKYRRHKAKPLQKDISLQFTEYQGKYYLQYMKYTDEYEDYGWSDSDSFAIVKHQAEFIVNYLKVHTLIEASLRSKYGNIEHYEDVKILHNQDTPPIPYHSLFWQSYVCPPFNNWDKLKTDLEKKFGSLEKQFVKNSELPEITQEEIKAIQSKYDPEFLRQINKKAY